MLPPLYWLNCRALPPLAAELAAVRGASQRRCPSPSQSESCLRLEKLGVRGLLVSTAAASQAFSRSNEAEGEEAAAVRWTAHSGSSFPPKRRAVVFVQGPSVRQLA
ncbi:hypothetical protein PBY51_003002 [Eleginops maclovinus]|uniref:Uncharacterized protein n=1 Tax=Eleginops maclovinus TaxID=56733 RepID=A0AAN7XDL1_ELEMC|nr:hypothetical protein PBY51_003002 [Eleginops maclovinus]